MTEDTAKVILLTGALYIGIGRAVAEYAAHVYTEVENARGRVVWTDEMRPVKWILALLWPAILWDVLR